MLPFVTVLFYVQTGRQTDRQTDKSLLLIKYCSNYQIEKNETGEACSTYGGEEICIQGCGVGKPEVKNHLKYPGIDGTIILRWIFRKWHGEVWTGLSWLRIGTCVRQL